MQVLDQPKGSLEPPKKSQIELHQEKEQLEAQKAEDERARKLEMRREKQRELDRVIAEQEAKRLEEERLDLQGSESEYEDEFVDDLADDLPQDKDTISPITDYGEAYNIDDLLNDLPQTPKAKRISIEKDNKIRDEERDDLMDPRQLEEAERLGAKKEYEAEVARYEEEAAAERARFEEEEFERDAIKMEAERITNAQRRIVEGEKRRRDEKEREKAELEEKKRRDLKEVCSPYKNWLLNLTGF
jgi:hypothetical protein